MAALHKVIGSSFGIVYRSAVDKPNKTKTFSNKLVTKFI